MDHVHRYQEKAFECLGAAKDMGDPAGRLDLLQIAQHWLRLADHVARWAPRAESEGRGDAAGGPRHDEHAMPLLPGESVLRYGPYGRHVPPPPKSH